MNPQEGSFFNVPMPNLFKGLRSPIRKVSLLAGGKELPWRLSGGRIKHNRPPWLYVTIPEGDLDPYATVVKIEFEGELCEIDSPNGKSLKWKGRPTCEEAEVRPNE